MPKGLARRRCANNSYGLGAAQARYREDGTWYHPLDQFPGVLFDAGGYVRFESPEEYRHCEYVKKGPDPNHIHVEDGIAMIPTYVKLDPPPQQKGRLI
jgi:hypothetical protein